MAFSRTSIFTHCPYPRMSQDNTTPPPAPSPTPLPAEPRRPRPKARPRPRKTANPQPTEKVAEKEAFKLWLAMPSWERVPKSQQELAKRLNVDEGTLSDWKRIPGFKDEVTKLAKEWAQAFLPDVLGAMVHAAADRLGGTAADRKLFLQYVQDWAEKQQHDFAPGSVTFNRPTDGAKPANDKPQASPG